MSRRFQIAIAILILGLLSACSERLRLVGSPGGPSEMSVLFINDEMGEAVPCG